MGGGCEIWAAQPGMRMENEEPRAGMGRGEKEG